MQSRQSTLVNTVAYYDPLLQRYARRVIQNEAAAAIIVQDVLEAQFQINGLVPAKHLRQVLKTDSAGNEYAYRTNAANSVHKGVEAYVEFNILKFKNPSSKSGLSIFNSLGYTDAKYTRGEFKGNRVEAASQVIERVGVVYSLKGFSSTFFLLPFFRLACWRSHLAAAPASLLLAILHLKN